MSSSWKRQWGYEASLSVFGLKEIERKCEFPNVVHTIPDQRWYTPFHITGGTHHTRTQGTQTHRQRNWHTQWDKHVLTNTHMWHVQKYTHMRIAQYTPDDIDHVTLRLPSAHIRYFSSLQELAIVVTVTDIHSKNCHKCVFKQAFATISPFHI